MSPLYHIDPTLAIEIPIEGFAPFLCRGAGCPLDKNACGQLDVGMFAAVFRATRGGERPFLRPQQDDSGQGHPLLISLGWTKSGLAGRSPAGGR